MSAEYGPDPKWSDPSGEVAIVLACCTFLHQLYVVEMRAILPVVVMTGRATQAGAVRVPKS
jgi:hypothetical protein